MASTACGSPSVGRLLVVGDRRSAVRFGQRAADAQLDPALGPRAVLVALDRHVVVDLFALAGHVRRMRRRAVGLDQRPRNAVRVRVVAVRPRTARARVEVGRHALQRRYGRLAAAGRPAPSPPQQLRRRRRRRACCRVSAFH